MQEHYGEANEGLLSLKKLLDIHVQNSNLFHSLEIILTKENNFLPHVPPPMLYHLPSNMPYHMSSIVSTIMGVLLLQAMHLCLSREPTSLRKLFHRNNIFKLSIRCGFIANNVHEVGSLERN
jgi:hypothetical protein